MALDDMEKKGKKGGTAQAPALEQPVAFNWKRFFWIAVAILLFFWIVGALIGDQSDDAGVTASATPTAESTPKVTAREYNVQREVGFKTERRKDGGIPKGEERVIERGQKGVIEITYRVKTIDGEKQPREEVKRKVLRPSLRRIVLVGTYEAPKAAAATSGGNCTPGYSPCLPPMSDYDCAGGSGNGPGYTGTVSVTGSDPYDLDRDGDGVGCDRG